MNYEALDEALEYIETGKSPEIFSLIEFTLNDMEAAMSEITVLTEEGEEKQEDKPEQAKVNVWEKIKAFIKKVIDFIKIKLAVLCGKIASKLNKTFIKSKIDDAKKADKKNQLSKIDYSFTDFANLKAQMEKFLQDSNVEKYDISAIVKCDINNTPTEIDKALQSIASISNMLPKLEAKYNKFLKEAEAKSGNPAELSVKMSSSFSLLAACARSIKSIWAISDRIIVLCKKIIANPDEDYTELIEKINQFVGVTKKKK